MKTKLLLTFGLILLVGIALAGAAAAEPAHSAATSPDVSASTASFLCGLSQAAQTSVASEPAGLAQPPVLKAGAQCGACSLNPCVNAVIGQPCQIGLRRGTCQTPYGDLCSGTLTFKCQCWSGPLP